MARWMLLRALLLLAPLIASSQDLDKRHLTPRPDARSGEAYVTLLYDESFLLGVRVLGQSLRETRTSRDMVVLLAGPISAAASRTLSLDGWIVRHVDVLPNPGRGPQQGGFPARFWAVYTKLEVFALEQYSKVIYLDADMLVLRNIDHLFGCPALLCAAVRHSERFNTGTMVLQPSRQLYQQLAAAMATTPSYTGGDQGFLNTVFSDLPAAPLFAPAAPSSSRQLQELLPQLREAGQRHEAAGNGSSARTMRLRTVYNADIGLFVVNGNRWAVPRSQLHVLHYTLGPLKPWQWWGSWLLAEAGAWREARARLPPDAAGRTAGLSRRQAVAKLWLPLLPCAVALLVLSGGRLRGLQQRLRSLRGVEASPGKAATGGRHGSSLLRLVAASLAAGYGSLGLAVVLVALLVPAETTPGTAWCVAYEWGFCVWYGLYCLFLDGCLPAGRRARPAGCSRPWRATAACALAVALPLMAAPWCSHLLGLRSLVGTVLATVACALVGSVVLTASLVLLPLLWSQQLWGAQQVDSGAAGVYDDHVL